MSDPTPVPAAPRGPTERPLDPAEAEYPASRWPRIYAVVFGVLVVDILVFGFLTGWYS